MEHRRDHRFDPSSDEAARYDDLAFDDIDYSDPLAFFKAIGAGQPGGLPIPKLLSPQEVRKQAKAMSTSVFENYHLLKSILERHEATIHKRWKKKTQEQRRKILLNAWGGRMSTIHRPDFEAFRKETEAQREAGTQRREAFMWPYINQEDLIKPRTLLLLLNARGRHDPATFAAADYEAMHLGLVTKAIVPIFLNSHVMLFRGRTEAKSYGELLSWDDHPDAFTWLHTRKEHQPGEGLLILEVQDRLMSFLVSCAKQILLDLSEVQLLEGPSLPEPSSVSENQSGPASLAIMAAEAPYRVPSQLNFVRIESLLAAKRDEAADHLWSFREDPGYFNLHMRDASEHRQEMLKDSSGQAHPLFRKHREEILWGRVLSNELIGLYLQVEMWSELHNQSVKLRTMQSNYSTQIKPQDDLPANYLEALLKFQHWLTQATKGPMNVLQGSVAASPPWRRYFERQPISDPTETRIITSSKQGVKFDKTEQQLLWLLRTLWEDSQPLFLVGITNLMDELQRLLDGDAKASSMITSYISSAIADLSIITECLHQINLYQPWANTFEDAMVNSKDTIMKDFANRTEVWGRMLGAVKGDSEKLLAQYGAPNEVDFRYPIDKRKTRENIETMRLAEANLDRFWARFDETMYRGVGNMQDTAVRTLLTEPRILKRTPEWVEPSKSGPDRGTTDVDVLSRPLSEIYLDLQQRTERTIERQKKTTTSFKPKEKTRGQLSATAAPPPDIPYDDPNSHDPQPTFQVDSRALKVFKTLFFTQSLTATPGEVPWTDFLHAMVSTGFEPEKLYGSVWQFNPGKLGVDRGINFHEPHPSGKIPYLIARRYGRRLNRAYGWHGGTFVLAQKTSQTKGGD